MVVEERYGAWPTHSKTCFGCLSLHHTAFSESKVNCPDAQCVPICVDASPANLVCSDCDKKDLKATDRDFPKRLSGLGFSYSGVHQETPKLLPTTFCGRFELVPLAVLVSA
jgi:hypothetical protein